MASNKAAFLDGPGKPLRIADTAMPEPGPDDIIVKNHAIATNPIDWYQAEWGIVIKNFPRVLGADVAGEVHEVGSNVKRFQKGERVCGLPQGLKTGFPEDGAYALYSRVPAQCAAIVPDTIPLKEAVVLPAAVGTVACGLYKEGYLGLPLPSTQPLPASGNVLVVYGGSSSISAVATQLASAVGVRVIALASQKNFDFCRQCGASAIFDYKDPDVVESVVKVIGDDEFLGIFESISTKDSLPINLAILEKFGGGKMAISQPLDGSVSIPSNVTATMMTSMGSHPTSIFENFVTPALESGRLKCLPEPKVVGKGLESLQLALQTLKAGVSAQKIVVEL